MTTPQFTVFCIFSGLVAIGVYDPGDCGICLLQIKIRDMSKRMEARSAKS